MGVLILVVASAACSLNKPVATAPPTTFPPSPNVSLVADIKAFEQTLGVEATNNFLRYSARGRCLEVCFLWL